VRGLSALRYSRRGESGRQVSDRTIRRLFHDDLKLSAGERRKRAASVCAALWRMDGDALGDVVRCWINRTAMESRGAVGAPDLLRKVNSKTRAGIQLSALRWFRAGRRSDDLAAAFARTFPGAIEAEAAGLFDNDDERQESEKASDGDLSK